MSINNKNVEKVILAASEGQYNRNGYPLIFELYCYPDNNNEYDCLYLNIEVDDTQESLFDELYEETVVLLKNDIDLWHNLSSLDCDYKYINCIIKDFTDDEDACFEYNETTGEFFGNWY